jgi:hypothetical protein
VKFDHDDYELTEMDWEFVVSNACYMGTLLVSFTTAARAPEMVGGPAGNPGEGGDAREGDDAGKGDDAGEGDDAQEGRHTGEEVGDSRRVNMEGESDEGDGNENEGENRDTDRTFWCSVSNFCLDDITSAPDGNEDIDMMD